MDWIFKGLIRLAVPVTLVCTMGLLLSVFTDSGEDWLMTSWSIFIVYAVITAISEPFVEAYKESL